jgi:hypothetical protein
MLRKICLSLVLLFAFSTLTFLPAQTAKPDSDLQAMKSDVQRMRVMLNQMRNNLAFVDNTQSPLKHQFELETDMWQVMLDQMDRRIAVMESSHQQSQNK